MNTYLQTYKHTLNPTHERDSWSKSDQGFVIPPEPMNRRKGRKTMLRRRELGEETGGFTRNKVSRKVITMKCSICSKVGHNKRFHGRQQVN